MGIYARGNTFSNVQAGALRGRITEEVAKVSKLGGSYEQALKMKQLEELRGSSKR